MEAAAAGIEAIEIVQQTWQEAKVVPATPAIDEALYQELERALVREEGRLRLPAVQRCTAIIWWERDGPRL